MDVVTFLTPQITMRAAELVFMYSCPQLDVCLVLDIHGTLLCDEYTYLYPRPHLRSFLLAAFGMCRHVAIWTAARLRDIPKDIDVIAAHTPADCKYEFVWDERDIGSRLPIAKEELNHEDCYAEFSRALDGQKHVAKIWNTPELREKGFTRENTVLIDNHVPECSAQDCIKIKTFIGSHIDAVHDNELLTILGQLYHYRILTP